MEQKLVSCMLGPQCYKVFKELPINVQLHHTLFERERYIKALCYLQDGCPLSPFSPFPFVFLLKNGMDLGSHVLCLPVFSTIYFFLLHFWSNSDAKKWTKVETPNQIDGKLSKQQQ